MRGSTFNLFSLLIILVIEQKFPNRWEEEKFFWYFLLILWVFVRKFARCDIGWVGDSIIKVGVIIDLPQAYKFNSKLTYLLLTFSGW